MVPLKNHSSQVGREWLGVRTPALTLGSCPSISQPWNSLGDENAISSVAYADHMHKSKERAKVGRTSRATRLCEPLDDLRGTEELLSLKQFHGSCIAQVPGLAHIIALSCLFYLTLLTVKTRMPRVPDVRT